MMPKSLKQAIEDRNLLIAQDRALFDDASKSASEKNEQSDKLNADIAALDKEIEAFKGVEERKERASKRESLQSDPLPRQTQAIDPARVPDKLAERLSLKFGRNEYTVERGSELGKRSTPEYLASFDRYLMSGGRETLGLVVGKDDKGGVLAPTMMASQIIKFLDDEVHIRKYATVLGIEGNESLGAVSYDADPGNADWTAEVPASDLSEDDTMAFGKRELRPHLLTKFVKASQKFLRTAGKLPGGAASFIGNRLAYKFAITEEANFMSGSGAQRPLGLFTASNDAIPTSRDTTCASATAFTADEVINCLYALKPQYQDRCVGIWSREFVKRARKLKDGTGAYLWVSGVGLTGTQPDTILGRPYIQSENAPSTFTTGLYIGGFFDLSHYWIVDSLDIAIQPLYELLALRNQVGWVGRKETDAMFVLAEAASRLILG